MNPCDKECRSREWQAFKQTSRMPGLIAVIASWGVSLAVVWLIVNATHTQPLPHRPLQEIDIQGHQPGTPGKLCPGQYEYRNREGFFSHCWGKK